jgi:hypothetical protein
VSDFATARRVTNAAAGIAAVMCGWLVVLHLRMIVSPAPQEMREGAIIWITRLLLEGRNPYALSELPASTNAYGIVYHLVVLPFARLFGNGFTVHRAVSAAAIWGACALLYRLLRREGAERVLALVGVMLFYASSLYFVAPLARPDGLGVLFCMASITWLFTDDLTPRTFLIGLLFALLALLTKIYLAFPPFLVALYVFLFVSPKRGLIYGITAVVASLAALLAMTAFYPAYINLSLIDHANSSAYYNVDHMRRQTLDWLLYSLPLTVGVVVVLVRAVVNGSLLRITRTRPSRFGFASAVNAAVLFAVFAGHAGAHMTYLFHLVTPLLIVALLPRLCERPWARALVVAALPIAFVANAGYFPLTFSEFRDSEATFAKLTHAIRSHTHVLGSTEVAGLLALSGQPVVDSGHSEYFGTAATDRRWPGLLSGDVIRTRWDDFLNDIQAGIIGGRFDLIIRDRRPGLIPGGLVAAHYDRVATIDVAFPWGAQRWPLDLWEPIH